MASIVLLAVVGKIKHSSAGPIVPCPTFAEVAAAPMNRAGFLRGLAIHQNTHRMVMTVGPLSKPCSPSRTGNNLPPAPVWLSRTVTCSPRVASAIAAASPPTPAPMITIAMVIAKVSKLCQLTLTLKQDNINCQDCGGASMDAENPIEKALAAALSSACSADCPPRFCPSASLCRVPRWGACAPQAGVGGGPKPVAVPT